MADGKGDGEVWITGSNTVSESTEFGRGFTLPFAEINVKMFPYKKIKLFNCKYVFVFA